MFIGVVWGIVFEQISTPKTLKLMFLFAGFFVALYIQQTQPQTTILSTAYVLAFITSSAISSYITKRKNFGNVQET